MKNLDLIIQLTKTSFKLRNEGSYLGIAWYLLNPLLMFVLLYFIFSKNLGTGVEYYPLYLLLGLIQFNFITLATGASMENIIQNSHLIKSLNFSRESLIISNVLMALISHFFELLVFIIFLLFFGITPYLLPLFLIVLLMMFLFTLGLCFALSSIMIYFRDLNNIWMFASRIWWFGTPIFYVVTEANGMLYKINLFNPMYHIISISRDLLIYSKLPDLSSVLILVGFTAVSFVFGYLIFNKLKNKFAEMV